MPNKPSDQIRAAMPGIVRQRLQKAVRESGNLLSGIQEQHMLQLLNSDPLSWIMAIMAYLDGQQQGEEFDRREAERPSTRFRPALTKDGNQWCVLYGENLQDGIAGFGDTPELAMLDFDKNWENEPPTSAFKVGYEQPNPVDNSGERLTGDL